MLVDSLAENYFGLVCEVNLAGLGSSPKGRLMGFKVKLDLN